LFILFQLFYYPDLFVIIISIGLASKFKQINDDLMSIKGLSVPPGFWAEYRLYYREITNLIYIVDKAMAKIILISISNNLFFICVQLLRSLEYEVTEEVEKKMTNFHLLFPVKNQHLLMLSTSGSR
jgi:hypothetical protein